MCETQLTVVCRLGSYLWNSHCVYANILFHNAKKPEVPDTPGPKHFR